MTGAHWEASKMALGSTPSGRWWWFHKRNPPRGPSDFEKPNINGRKFMGLVIGVVILLIQVGVITPFATGSGAHLVIILYRLSLWSKNWTAGTWLTLLAGKKTCKISALLYHKGDVCWVSIHVPVWFHSDKTRNGRVIIKTLIQIDQIGMTKWLT